MGKIIIANQVAPSTPSIGTTTIYVDSITKKINTKDDAGLVSDYGAAGSAITALTGDVTAAGPGSSAATIPNGTITNAKSANVATQTIKGRTTAGTGDPEDLTATQATAILNQFVGDSGAGGLKGLVTVPAIGDATKFLKGDGTWSSPAGAGDVQGPASSVDSEIALFNSTTGKIIKRATGTGVVKSTSGVFSVAPVALASEVSGTLPITNGGTGQTTANTAFNALSPMTTNGDLITQAAGIASRIPVGSSGQILTVSAGAPSWQAASTTDPFTTTEVLEHFFSGTDTTPMGVLGWQVIATGTANVAVRINGEDRRPGIYRINAGTAGTGRACITLGNTATYSLTPSATGQNIKWTSRLRITGDLNTFEMFVGGLGDLVAAAGDQLNGIYFQLLGNPTPDTNWFLVSSNGGTRTRLNTGIAFSSTAWVDLEFSYDVPTASITGKINGTSFAGSITTNIPTTAIAPMYKCDAIATGAAVNADLDIFRLIMTGTTL